MGDLKWEKATHKVHLLQHKHSECCSLDFFFFLGMPCIDILPESVNFLICFSGRMRILLYVDYGQDFLVIFMDNLD